MTSERLEPRRLLASMEVDLTFGEGGIAGFNETPVIANFYVVRQLSDGRIIGAGFQGSGPTVARFHANGSLDTSFGGGDGQIETSRNTSDTSVFGVDGATGPDGKIVLLHKRVRAVEEAHVDRFNADGSIDTSFGVNGLAIIPDADARAVAVQADGKILVLYVDGTMDDDVPRLIRLNVNGSVDTTFRNGVAATGPLGNLDLTVAPNGRIYFVGDQGPNGQSLVGALTPAGFTDTSFDDDGLAHLRPISDSIRTRLSTIAADAQNRVVVKSHYIAGSDESTVITRFTLAGERDPSFGGGDGRVDVDLSSSQSSPIAFGPNGTIAFAMERSDAVPAIFRFNADGTPDATFGDNGQVTPTRTLVEPAAMAFDAEGNVLLGGDHDEPHRLAIVRFVPQAPAVALDAAGTIHVAITEGPDTIALRREGDQVVVRFNGVDTAFAAADVSALKVPASAGNDVVTVPFALDCTIDGGTGDDTITVGDGQMSLSGWEGNDVITAGRGAHKIDLWYGDDRVTTGAGNDTISGWDGNDTITTGPGGDFVSGGRGDDSITTSVGFDTIHTSDGNDTVRAGAGHDLVIGSRAPNGSHDQYDGSKLIFGGDGDDSLMGGADPSTVFGEGGNDTLAGGPQSDSLDGGAGDDEIGTATFAPSVGTDTIVSAGPEDDVTPQPPTPVDGEPESIVTSANTAGGYDLALAGDGIYIVAANIVAGDVHRVTVFRYSAAGALLGDPIPLYSYVPQTVPFLRTASIGASTDADGDAVVAYAVNDGDDSGTYFTLISRTGTVGRTVRVADAVSEFGGSVSVSMDAGGGFFLAWHVPDDRDGTTQARAYDASGNPRAEPFVIAPNAGLHSNGPSQIVSLPDGSGAVFARDMDVTVGLGSIGTVVFGRTSTSAILDSGSIRETYDVSSPSIAVQPDGSFAIGYRYFDGPAVFGAQLRRYTAAGDQIGGAFALGSSLPGGGNGIRHASVDAAPDGGYVVSFVHPRDGVDTAYAARFDAAGAFDANRGYVPFATDVSSDDARFGDGRFRPSLEVNASGTIAAYKMRSSDELRTRRLRIGQNGADLRGSELYVDGTDGDDHIIVETVRDRVYVNVNGTVQRFAASAVQFLSISGYGGDDDIVNATALPATIHGGDGFDTIWGGTGPDRIRGFGGNDRLFGGDGDDQVFGDAGSDHVSGGDDNDNLQGDVGEDTLLGGSGNDLLLGHRGSDRLFGEAGNDVLLGGDADDYLEAGAGHDELYGQAGRDALFGLSGNDRLFADDGATDTVRGGPGDDSGNVDDEDDVLAVEAVT